MSKEWRIAVFRHFRAATGNRQHPTQVRASDGSLTVLNATKVAWKPGQRKHPPAMHTTTKKALKFFLKFGLLSFCIFNIWILFCNFFTYGSAYIWRILKFLHWLILHTAYKPAVVLCISFNFKLQYCRLQPPLSLLFVNETTYRRLITLGHATIL